MSRKPAKDPFAYFNSGKDADIPNVDSESESDEENDNDNVSDTDTTKNPVSYISKSGDSSAENKLPSAEKALEETVKPKFLESHKTKGHIDWEKHVKNDTLQEEEVSITNTHAIRIQTISVPDRFGHGTEMVTLITVSVPHDRRFGPVRSE